MDLIRTLADLQRLEPLRRDPRPLVMVPTMGALHQGHLDLVRRAKELGEVVVSIFVNPTQFGPGEDYAAYPRDDARDLDLLRPLGTTAVFMPTVDLMYPRERGVSILAGSAADGLCGASRPGHFNGVLTVVAKLFNLVRPDLAVFGRKDAQQCLVIDQMVQDLNMPVRLIDHPTVREPDGLAMSSRNVYLKGEARTRALSLSRALRAGVEALKAGERDPARIESLMATELASCDSLEYAVARRVPDLATLDSLSGRVLLAVAARVEPARLIDNLVVEVSGDKVTETSLLITPAELDNLEAS